MSIRLYSAPALVRYVRVGDRGENLLEKQVVARDDFAALFTVLDGEGYTIVGPTIRDQAIVYDELSGVEDLPVGWIDEQERGAYRLRERGDGALFGYAIGPQSWKQYLFPPRSTLLDVRRVDGSLAFVPGELPEARYAFIGVRACELAAISIQDKVFLEAGAVDRIYQASRSGVFTVAVNCSVAGGACFCVSMGTGPACTSGFDLALTEILDGDRHEFLFEAGTPRGEDVLSRIPRRSATAADTAAAAGVVSATAANMGRSLDTSGIKELLYANEGHPRWDDAADRCLACTNCTIVCPTCFCSSVEDATTQGGDGAIRTRRWDSCFTLDFSSLHGVPVRASTRSRYRQWMTHKLASWYDQFGTSGCVGCGRCIVWCPVGIDITEEAAAIRSTTGATP